MASIKNTNRRKRKYADQASRTTRNKAARVARHDRREQRFAQRAEALMGERVDYGDGIGTVTDVLDTDVKEKRPRTLVIVDENSGAEKLRTPKRVKRV
jgi:hypothetical protein